MEDVLKVGALLEGHKTLKDRSLKVTFHTQEISPEMGATLMRMNQSFGWMLFCPESSTQIEIPSEPPKDFRSEKTPAQRLRGVLFVWWKQLGGEGDFERFYRDKVESMIGWVKDKLDEGEK